MSNQFLSFNLITAKILKCYCEGQCPDGSHNGTCETRPGGLCFASVTQEETDDGDYEEIRSYGCMAPHDAGGFWQVNISFLCIIS